MSEKDYRSAIAAVLADIDHTTREVGRRVGRGAKKVVLPAALGAGLALSLGGCGDDTGNKLPANDLAYGAPFEMGVSDKGAKDVLPGPFDAYGVPFETSLPNKDTQPDGQNATDAGPDAK